MAFPRHVPWHVPWHVPCVSALRRHRVLDTGVLQELMRGRLDDPHVLDRQGGQRPNKPRYSVGALT